MSKKKKKNQAPAKEPVQAPQPSEETSAPSDADAGIAKELPEPQVSAQENVTSEGAQSAQETVTSEGVPSAQETEKAENPEETAEKKKIQFPAILTVSPAPHVRSAVTTRSIMLDVVIALLPAYIWGVYYFGLRALLIGIVAVASAVIFEALTQMILHRPVTIGDYSAVVTGLLLAMNLSSAVPIWMPVVGAFFAVVVVKQLFGGIGKNIVNPALCARVFLFAWPAEMGTFTAPGVRLPGLGDPDIVASATPLVSLKSGVFPDIQLFDMFIGRSAGCIGEVSSVLLIAGGLYLLIRRVITWHIPFAYLATVAVLTLLFPQVDANNFSFMLCELLSGGLMLGAFFMATDYATSPVTCSGRLIYGVGCGLITVFIRYFGGYPEGVSFSILIMNLLVWYIDRFTMPVRFGGKSVEKKEQK